MLNRWQLPDHISDILPSRSKRIEHIRRSVLDGAFEAGYELVIPPLVEHLESLQMGTGAASRSDLDLQTFKLVDQLSGRTLAVRADTTPQVSRIDAHMLHGVGVNRLCYCGPVLHTRPSSFDADREPLQFGAEIYGDASLGAELESIQLALRCLALAGVQHAVTDVSDVRIARALLDDASVTPLVQAQIYEHLASKDAPALAQMPGITDALRGHLLQLLRLHGGVHVLAMAKNSLPQLPVIAEALQSLGHLHEQLSKYNLRFDLADLGSYGYYTATRFAVYAPGAKGVLVRGGRYDQMTQDADGKNSVRPAVGFSLDVKLLT